MQWIFACLLIVILCFFVLDLDISGRSIMASLSVSLERRLPDFKKHPDAHRVPAIKPGGQIRSNEHRFTDLHVKQAMEDLLSGKKQPQFSSRARDLAGGEGEYRYEIELNTVGWIYTEKAEVTDAEVIYKSVSGIVVALNRDQVKTIKKTKAAD